MNIKNIIQKIRRKYSPSNIHNALEELYIINRKLDVIEKKLDLYGIQIYRRDDESNFDARLRLFRNLPEASGPMALYQAVNNKMLSAFSQICEENHLDYWLWSGSAIAAVARGKSIPWDDDIDICMMREDFNKLSDILKNNVDYQASEFYSFPARNITYRFVSRNEKILNFIDIVPCDWAAEATTEANQTYKEYHQALENEFAKNPHLSYWRDISWLVPRGMIHHMPVNRKEYRQETADHLIGIIDEIYNRYFSKAKQDGLLCEEKNARAVAYGLDNMFDKPQRKDLWDRDIIFPTHQIKYEDLYVRITNQEYEFCEICFPGWPYLPNDICNHMHSGKNVLKDSGIISAMEEFLQK